MEHDIIQILFENLNSENTQTLSVILVALDNILNCGKNHFMENGKNLFLIKLEQYPTALKKIEEL